MKRFAVAACLSLLSIVTLSTQNVPPPQKAASASPATAPTVARNVIVVSYDGARWQEAFGGAQPELLDEKRGGVSDLAATRKRFARDDRESARSALMPFFWHTIAVQGQVFGDPAANSLAHVTNGLWFSYPGYSEMMTGHADPRVDSNDKVPNPNVNVLEWLNGRPSFKGRVAAFGSWEVLPYILNSQRGGLPVNGDGPPIAHPRTATDRLLNDFAADIAPIWGETRLDAATMAGALECLKGERPRVLYVLLGETDEWGHERRYDLYLDALWRSDRFVKRMWETAQSMPEYAGKTALIVAVDHGRGAAVSDWTDHGRKVPAAERVWMAAMGAGVPGMGVRKDVTVTLSQVAATIAAVVGEDFRSSSAEVAAPLPLKK